MSQPCWVTSTSGRNARTSGGTTAWNARSHAGVARARRQRDVDRVPSAPGPPISPGKPVPGKSIRPLSCSEMVSTRGSSQKIACDAVAVVHVDVDVRDPLGAVRRAASGSPTAESL